MRNILKQKMINWRFPSIKNNKNIINILLIFISIFIFTIMPLNDVPVDLQHADSLVERITAFSSGVVNNWLIDGIINDNFVMYEDFASVEFENNNDRCLYVSYPPGSLIPLYFVAKIIGEKEVSIGFVKRFVQFEYYLSIFILGLLFYICLKYLEIKSRLLIIFLPVILSSLWAFLPFNVYYMKNVYFADEAGILLSIIFFLIEIVLYNKQQKEWGIPLQILSSIVLFAGILTDYYFFCIAFIAIWFRIITSFQDYPEKPVLYKLFSNTWALIVSTIIAVSLFIIQILSIDYGLRWLAVTFRVRTGNGTELGGIETLIQHFGNGFTILFIPILVFVTIFCVIFPFIRNNYSKEKQMIIRWLSIIILSAVLHTIILRQHSIMHEFSMLKYNLVFVFIIFTFIYWIYINYINKAVVSIKKYSGIILTFIIFLMLFCFASLKSYDQKFYNSRTWIEDHSIAKFIREKTSYNDVVYSPDYEISCDPKYSHELAISKKRIYQVSRINEIPVNNLPDHAIINILISRDSIEKGNWNKLLKAKIFFSRSDNFYLFKFSKELFHSVIN